MNGAQSLLQTLVNCEVEVCFANPGTSEMHFVAALDRVEGMRCVLGLFEGVCSGAADGYYRMGDIVRKQDRNLYTDGRRKDLINRGGEKISCEEVENFIHRHPAVKSACQTGDTLKRTRHALMSPPHTAVLLASTKVTYTRLSRRRPTWRVANSLTPAPPPTERRSSESSGEA